MRRPLPTGLAACAALLPACAPEGEAPAPQPPEVVLRVEGEPVTRTEIETLAAYLAPNNPNGATDLLRSTALARTLLPRALAFARHRETLAPARERIERAKARLGAGEDFALVAKDLSDHAPEKGGDAGWLARAEIDPVIGIEAFDAPIGETRGPIRTMFGFALIQVLERKEDPTPGRSGVRIREILAAFETTPRSLRDFARDLEKASVEVLDPAFFDRIRPTGLAPRFGAPASRPRS